MVLSHFNKKFYLVYNNDKLEFIDSFEKLKQKYEEAYHNKKTKNNENDESNNNFLIVSEFIHSTANSFKIFNPILSSCLRKEIKDVSILCRSWKLSKKNEENVLGIGDIIKLGRVRLKIDTICLGDIFESSLITNNILKNKTKILNNTINNNINNNTTTNFNNNINTNSRIICNSNNNIINPYNNNISININNRNDSFGSEESADEEKKINHNNDIENEDETANKNMLNNEKSSQFSKALSQKTDGLPCCRVCYSSKSDIENPLICPCKCCGSIKFIHYICLKSWLEENITTKTEPNFKIYTWKSFCCEVCKEEYPKYIRYKELLYPLVELEIPYVSFVTCDYTLYDDMKKKIFRKGILIFKINEDAEEEVISVGRSQTNKIKLKDISVSRYHCNFVKRKNKLLIVDRGSKFGTLIYLNHPLVIDQNNKEGTLISGRHWFSINLQQKNNFFSKIFSIKCCECSEIKKNYDIDVELLGEDGNIKENKEDKDFKNNNDIGNLSNNNIKYGLNGYGGTDGIVQIIDESYQDYVLDLGENIYLNQSLEDNKNNK